MTFMELIKKSPDEDPALDTTLRLDTLKVCIVITVVHQGHISEKET